MNLARTLIILLLVTLSCSDIVTLDKEVFRQIYQENKIFIIYVHGEVHNFEVESIFNSHCFGQKLCAILEPNNPDYYEFLQFIGYPSSDFFIIFDPLTKRKFIHPIPQTPLTSNDLLSFQYKFIYKEVQPFFASEPLPSQANQRCSKLVGKNIGEFLRRAERVKVILLYNLNHHCQDCDDILKQFIRFAEKNFEEKILAFGYFNIFLNDHPVIQDQKSPSFLIFLDQQIQSPYQLQAGDLRGLSFFLGKTLGRSFEGTHGEAEKQGPEVAEL